MIDLFMTFRDSPFYIIVGVVLIGICFIETLKRCKQYYIEKRDGKAEAELEALREKEGLGSEVWEAEQSEASGSERETK